MRAALFRRHGDVSVMELADVPAPPCGPGDVRIAVKAAALNHLDVFVRDGWPGLKLPLPHVGGTDVAGLVTEVGTAVAAGEVHAIVGGRSGKGSPNHWIPKVGDAVLVNPGLNFEADPATGEQRIPPDVSIVGETRWGGFATECVVPATHVLPKPAAMRWEEAAGLPLTSITASQMVHRKGRVRPGDRVLVVGAGGGVAVMALQMAKAAGAWVCATTGGPAKLGKVKALGADHVIDYKASPDWAKEAFLATGKKGFDVVIDSTGPATFAKSLRSLTLGGRLVLCGATTGQIGEADLKSVFWKQLSILGSTMGTPQDLADALDAWQAGKLKVVVDSIYPLDRIQDAMRHMENAGQFGKIIVVP